jgi:hypothetical protein
MEPPVLVDERHANNQSQQKLYSVAHQGSSVFVLLPKGVPFHSVRRSQVLLATGNAYWKRCVMSHILNNEDGICRDIAN